MHYYRLRQRFRQKADRGRVIENLIRLREQLDQDVPKKDADDHLLLGTWNVRDLGKKSRWGYGPRLAESFFYIAEIISRFDLVAVQEVNELESLEVVMDILGPDWDFIATDVTDRSLGGNGERLTYVYDTRKVKFQNIAGEVVLPADMLISRVEFEGEEDDDSKRLVAGKQFRRSPFLTRFQSGWLKFDLCTVHIYYGSDYGSKLDERIDEIRQVANYMAKRADDGLKEHGRAMFLLGDFNIKRPEHETMRALTDSGFVVPEALQHETNINRDKYYDQIAFKTKPDVLEFVEQSSAGRRNAGVLEVMKSVFREDDFVQYVEACKATKTGKKASNKKELREHYLKWRTWQMSDHNLLWARLETNDSAKYLERLAGE